MPRTAQPTIPDHVESPYKYRPRNFVDIQRWTELCMGARQHMSEGRTLLADKFFEQMLVEMARFDKDRYGR